MTGMVKEEILTRMAEVGLLIEDGKLTFDTVLVRAQDLLAAPSVFRYFDVDGEEQQLHLPIGSVAYTFCQVPIVLKASHETQIIVNLAGTSAHVIKGNVLDADLSKHLFLRDGAVRQVTVFCSGLVSAL
jgi:hypothetical protein